MNNTNNTLVIYKSKYGASEQYAKWIAEDLGADIFEASIVSAAQLEKYSVVVFCGGIYMGAVNGIKTIINNCAALSGKKIIVAACGLSDTESEENFRRIKDALCQKLPRPIRENVKLFLLDGGVSYSRQRFFDKFVVKMIEKALRKKKPETLSSAEQRMLEVIGGDSSFVNRAAIKKIVDACKTE